MNLTDILTAILNIFILFVPFVLVLPYPLKCYQYIAMWCFIAGCMLLLQRFGQITSFSILIGCVLLVAAFAQQKKLNMLCSLIGYISNVFLNYMYTYAINILTGRTLEDINSTIASYLIYLCVFLLLQIGALLFLRWLLFGKLHLIDIQISPKNLTYILGDAALCASIFIINFTFGETLGYPPAFIAINSLLFGIYFIFTVFLLLSIAKTTRQEENMKHMADRYNTLQEYTARVEETYQEIRTFRHDYINILSTLYGFMHDKKYAQLEQYFEEHVLDTSKQFDASQAELGKLSRIRLTELKGLLITKSIHALNLGLHLHMEINVDFDSSHMDSLDLVRLLGIYFDNAIEASEKSKDKKIIFSVSRTNGCTSIMLANSCDTDNLPLDSLNTAGYSTKGSGRGIGLYNAAEILTKYPDVYPKTSYTDHLFIQTLENI